MKTLSALICLLCCLNAQAAWWWSSASTSWVEIQANDSQPGPALTNSFTMSAWIMRTVDRGTTRAGILGKTSSGNICYEWSIITNRINFRYSGPGGGVVHTWQATDTAPGLNVPAHLAMKFTYGTPGSMVLFVNGTNFSGGWIVGDGTIPATNTTDSLDLGIAFSATPLVGIFSEIAIWNSLLPNQEMLSLYNSRLKRYPMMVSPSSLMGYWPLDGWPENKQQTSDTVPLAINMKEGVNLYGSFEGFGNIRAANERWLSYPPNE